MPIEGLDTFTDRREALALFDVVRGRDPAQPWPLLPILAFIAPGGSAHPMRNELQAIRL